MFAQQESSSEIKAIPERPQRKVFWNKKLITIKLHYILFFGGQAAVLPYIPVLAKQLGITASALGIVYGVLPFVAFLVTPFLCNLADRFRCLTLALTIGVICTIVSYGGISFIPEIRGDLGSLTVTVRCGRNGSLMDTDGVVVNASCRYEETKPTCKCSNPKCLALPAESYETSSGGFCQPDIQEYNFSFDIENSILQITSAWAKNNSLSLSCDSPVSVTCDIVCSNLSPCVTFTETEMDRRIFKSHEYWIFLVLMLISWISAATVVSLADSLCYQLLGDKPQLYGQQRLWGTVGWGVIGTICGYWLNTTSDASQEVDFRPAYYLMAALMGADALMISQVPFRQRIQEDSRSSKKDLLEVFKDFRAIWFLFEVFVIGLLTGLFWTYSFWFFEDIGSNLLVLGLAVAVQSFLGELPFFYFSGRIIKRIGHFHALALSFASYAVRYVAYFLVLEPWVILPLELLHGPGYSLFYSTMTSFASKVAPDGLEASVQGIMIGSFENLGAPLGGLFGGFLLDYIGGRRTFLSAGFFSLAFGVLYIFMHVIYFRKRERL